MFNAASIHRGEADLRPDVYMSEVQHTDPVFIVRHMLFPITLFIIIIGNSMRRAINARSLCRNFLLQGNLRDFCGRRNMSLLLQILISRSRLSSIADTSVAIGCCILVILRNFGHNCLVSLTLIFCFSGFAYLVTCVWHGPQPVRAVFYFTVRSWLVVIQAVSCAHSVAWGRSQWESCVMLQSDCDWLFQRQRAAHVRRPTRHGLHSVGNDALLLRCLALHLPLPHEGRGISGKGS